MLVNNSATEPGEPLTPKQEQLIAILVSGIHIVTAARTIGIAEKTAHRWLRMAHFQSAYKAAQKQLFDQALTGLMLKVDKAIETLDRNMDDVSSPAGTQVRAAQIVLEQAIQVHRNDEIDQRLRMLEERLRPGS